MTRAEWAAVARELDATAPGEDPSGLRSRIQELLANVPAGWDAQPCALALDPAAATVARAIVRRGRGMGEDPRRGRARAAGVAAAEAVIRTHQAPHDWRTFRIEHRTAGKTVVLGRTAAADARQADLSTRAAELMAAGATGELVLVDETTGLDVARRRLLARPNDEG